MLKTCQGIWPVLWHVDPKLSHMGPQYDICRDLSRTGPPISSVFFRIGKVPYSNF